MNTNSIINFKDKNFKKSLIFVLGTSLVSISALHTESWATTESQQNRSSSSDEHSTKKPNDSRTTTSRDGSSSSSKYSTKEDTKNNSSQRDSHLTREEAMDEYSNVVQGLIDVVIITEDAIKSLKESKNSANAQGVIHKLQGYQDKLNTAVNKGTERIKEDDPSKIPNRSRDAKGIWQKFSLVVSGLTNHLYMSRYSTIIENTIKSSKDYLKKDLPADLREDVERWTQEMEKFHEDLEVENAKIST